LSTIVTRPCRLGPQLDIHRKRIVDNLADNQHDPVSPLVKEGTTMSSTSVTGTRSGRLAGLVVAICWLVVLFDGVELFIYGAVLRACSTTRHSA
jgi:hypothetical protein